MTFRVTFGGPAAVGGRLEDGLDDLAVVARGAAPQGDAMAADHVFGFHRLFGDSGGDRDVDGFDRRRYRARVAAKI